MYNIKRLELTSQEALSQRKGPDQDLAAPESRAELVNFLNPDGG